MNNRERVLNHLQSIYPNEATNSEIKSATGVSPHQQVFIITQDLRKAGKITERQIGRIWHFKAVSPLSADETPSIPQPGGVQKPPKYISAQFESFARQVFSRYFGSSLRAGVSAGVPKIWDILSKNGEIIGDAKYYTLVGGTQLPPAKFSIIAEHVWLLEKTNARIKFLVFGNQIEVPKLWLKKYGDLVSDVDFYFLDDNGALIRLIQREGRDASKV